MHLRCKWCNTKITTGEHIQLTLQIPPVVEEEMRKVIGKLPGFNYGEKTVLKNLTLDPVLHSHCTLNSHKIFPKILTILPVTEHYFVNIMSKVFRKYLQYKYIVLIN